MSARRGGARDRANSDAADARLEVQRFAAPVQRASRRSSPDFVASIGISVRMFPRLLFASTVTAAFAESATSMLPADVCNITSPGTGSSNAASDRAGGSLPVDGAVDVLEQSLPPLVFTSVSPLNPRTMIDPPEVRASRVPPPFFASMAPPLVAILIAPSQPSSAMLPPLVRASSGRDLPELHLAAARVRFHFAGQTHRAHAAAARAQIGVEILRHANGVTCVHRDVAGPVADPITVLSPNTDHDRIAFFRDEQRRFSEVFLLARFVAAIEFPHRLRRSLCRRDPRSRRSCRSQRQRSAARLTQHRTPGSRFVRRAPRDRRRWRREAEERDAGAYFGQLRSSI